MKFTTEQIEAVRSKLKNLPEIEKVKKEHTKAETVRMLAKEITSLQKRGYALEQIADYLKGEGLDIGTPTLKSYLQRTKAAAVATSKSKAQAQKDTPPPAPPETSTPRPEVDKSKAYFTPRPDTDDI